MPMQHQIIMIEFIHPYEQHVERMKRDKLHEDHLHQNQDLDPVFGVHVQHVNVIKSIQNNHYKKIDDNNDEFIVLPYEKYYKKNREIIDYWKNQSV